MHKHKPFSFSIVQEYLDTYLKSNFTIICRKDEYLIFNLQNDFLGYFTSF